MLHPSLYFPDYPGPAKPRDHAAHPPEPTASAAPMSRRDFQRIVLPSGCVLFRLCPPRE
jgi:hypothetical protein